MKSLGKERVIAEILKESKIIAIVGLSPKRARASHKVAQYLKEHGYQIVPVNPGHSEILGERCYASLSEIPGRVDVVNVFRNPEYVAPIVEQAVKKGAGAFWMQMGLIDEAAARKAEEAGIIVIMNKCIMREHKKSLGEYEG